jgi:hypothetical protein
MLFEVYLDTYVHAPSRLDIPCQGANFLDQF